MTEITFKDMDFYKIQTIQESYFENNRKVPLKYIPELTYGILRECLNWNKIWEYVKDIDTDSSPEELSDGFLEMLELFENISPCYGNEVSRGKWYILDDDFLGILWKYPKNEDPFMDLWVNIVLRD